MRTCIRLVWIVSIVACSAGADPGVTDGSLDSLDAAPTCSQPPPGLVCNRDPWPCGSYCSIDAGGGFDADASMPDASHDASADATDSGG